MGYPAEKEDLDMLRRAVAGDVGPGFENGPIAIARLMLDMNARLRRLEKEHDAQAD
jgi:hypothetical protein